MSHSTRFVPNLRPPGWVAEFNSFIARGNVIDLAIGIVIGVAFTGVVNSLATEIRDELRAHP